MNGIEVSIIRVIIALPVATGVIDGPMGYSRLIPHG